MYCLPEENFNPAARVCYERTQGTGKSAREKDEGRTKFADEPEGYRRSLKRARERHEEKQHKKKSQKSKKSQDMEGYMGIVAPSQSAFQDLDYTFHVFSNTKDGKLYFVAQEILKDGLDMKGFRAAVRDIPRAEKMHRKIGSGNKKLCISEDGLRMILAKTRSDNRLALIAYLEENYDLKIPVERLEMRLEPSKDNEGELVMTLESEHEEEHEEGYEEEGKAPPESEPEPALAVPETTPVTLEQMKTLLRESTWVLEDKMNDMYGSMYAMQRKLADLDKMITAVLPTSFSRAVESQRKRIPPDWLVNE
jgi:hypothetical protein